jgi:hypothetical protein
MIRILPMDKEYEFDGLTIIDVQTNFFLKELPSRKDENGQGKYCYKSHGMKAEEGSTLVLFQYDNKIIACAKLNRIIKFDMPNDVYHGAFYFEPNTIKIFEPVTNEDIRSDFHCEIKFGQVKHILNVKYIDNFLNRLKNIKNVNMNNLQVNENSTCPPNS